MARSPQIQWLTALTGAKALPQSTLPPQASMPVDNRLAQVPEIAARRSTVAASTVCWCSAPAALSAGIPAPQCWLEDSM
ncbi:hypothetical protein D3C72_2187510 [compost metagenome]